MYYLEVQIGYITGPVVKSHIWFNGKLHFSQL